LALAGGAPRDAKDDAIKKDIAALQGEWNVVGAEKDGKKLSDEERKKLSEFFFTKVEIQDSTMKIWLKKGDDEPKAGDFVAFSVDPTKKPAVMTVGETPLIYKIDGDKLIVCFRDPFSKDAADLPTEFDTGKNQLWYAFELKKAKK
jgi:uncharacterized protein (TIGR03067 family)